MNNRGWGLNTMIILSTGLLIALFVSYYLIKGTLMSLVSPSIDIKTYQNYEAKVVTAAKSYVASNIKDIKDTVIVTIKTLIASDDLATLDDPNSTQNCSGYVVVNNTSYAPYIKCSSNYTTSGYSSSFDK